MDSLFSFFGYGSGPQGPSESGATGRAIGPQGVYAIGPQGPIGCQGAIGPQGPPSAPISTGSSLVKPEKVVPEIKERKLIGPQGSSTISPDAILPISDGGTNSGTALVNNRIIMSVGGALVEASQALLPGQFYIGTSSMPVAAYLTGTASRVLVSSGVGSIIVSTPQDIDVTSTPTFLSMTLSGITADKAAMYTNSSGLVAGRGLTSGHFLMGGTGSGDPIAAALLGTENRVSVSVGSTALMLTTPQDSHTGASPTFSKLTLTSASDQLLLGNATISATHQDVASRFVVPDIAVDSEFIMAHGPQTVPGAKTFSAAVTASNTTDASSTTTGSIVCAGGVGIAKKLYVGDAILLATSGGTPSELDYYEEYTHNTNLTGIWSSAQASTWDVTRVGRVVTCSLQADVCPTANTASTISFATALPTRFRPAAQMYVMYLAQDNGTVVISRVTIPTNGVLNFKNGANANFTGAGLSGVFKSVFSWTV
jgi:hypothetical protein